MSVRVTVPRKCMTPQSQCFGAYPLPDGSVAVCDTKVGIEPMLVFSESEWRQTFREFRKGLLTLQALLACREPFFLTRDVVVRIESERIMFGGLAAGSVSLQFTPEEWLVLLDEVDRADSLFSYEAIHAQNADTPNVPCESLMSTTA